MEGGVKKKRKFKKPKAGMRALSRVNQVGYAGVPVHGTGVYDALKHTVLTCSRLSDFDREFIEAKLKTITNGAEAKNLPTATNGWRCTVLDNLGRALLISYRGMEVALFYKRQLTEIKLLPGDTFPAGVLKDPNDAWQRLDLLGKSAKQANVVLTNLHSKLEETNSVLTQRVQALELLNADLETKLFRMTELLDHFTLNEKRMAARRQKSATRQADIKYKKELAKKKARIVKELAAKKKRRKRRKKK